MQVNLLPVEAKAAANDSPLRRKVYSLTTMILVIYVVAVAAVAGWSVFLSTRQTQLSQEVVDLSTRVQAQATKEASIRQQDHRLTEIESFLINRVAYAKVVSHLLPTSSDLQVQSLDYALSGKQTVAVSASSAASLEDYAQKLKSAFSEVSITSIDRKSADDWLQVVELANLKQ